jgi:hypothetical protein
MSYLRYLCLFAYSGIQLILCYVFVFFSFVLCILCCQFLWTVYFWLPRRYSLTFICDSMVFVAISFDKSYIFQFSSHYSTSMYWAIYYVFQFSSNTLPVDIEKYHISIFRHIEQCHISIFSSSSLSTEQRFDYSSFLHIFLPVFSTRIAISRPAVRTNIPARTTFLFHVL